MSVISGFETVCDRSARLFRSPFWFTLAVTIILVSLLSLQTGADPDLFHRLAMGKILVSGQAFPYQDPFSFTPKLPMWIDHEWLSGWIFYQCTLFGGDSALLILRAALYTLTVAVLCSALIMLTPPSVGAIAWFLLCMIHGSFGWASAVRCQMFTYLFIPLFILGILRAHLKDRWGLLALAPPIMVAWCNLHGGFVLGILLLLGFTGFSFIFKGSGYKAGIITALTITATAVNPYGFSTYWGYLLRALSMNRAAVLEWGPLWQQPDQFFITVALTLLAFVGLILAILERSRPVDSPAITKSTHLLLTGMIAASGYCAFRHSRFLVFYMVLLAPLGAPYCTTLGNAISTRLKSFALKISRVWALSIPVLVSITIAQATSTIFTRGLTLNYESYPEKAIHALHDSGKSGKLLLSFNVGGYALWRLYPQFLVSLDGRYETVYKDETVLLNERALSGDADAIEEIAPSDILILKDEHTTAITEKLADKWSLWYEDSQCILLQRSAD